MHPWVFCSSISIAVVVYVVYEKLLILPIFILDAEDILQTFSAVMLILKLLKHSLIFVYILGRVLFLSN
jgi:hypothetical protein